ncbi:MAG: hypothetical protein HUJ31_06210 [Pseudomonadales bacterium]|nr:hypothetical protein [Pseudomonadales bacterium]
MLVYTDLHAFRMMSANRILLWLFTIFLRWPVPVLALTKGEVIDELVASYGGEVNLQKLDTMQQFWKMDVVSRGTEGHDHRLVSLPDHLYVELMYPDRTEKRLLLGEKALRSYAEGPWQPAKPPQAAAMKLQRMRMYSPLTLRTKLSQVTLHQQGDHVVLSLQEDGLKVDYRVDKAAWQIEEVTGTMSMNGFEMSFRTEYLDFRRIDGVLIHHRERKFAGPVNTANLELLKIEFDPDLELLKFDPQNPASL